MNKGDGSAEAWLTSFTKQLRVQLPQGQYIITHARQSSLLFLKRQMLTIPFAAAVAPWFYGPKFGGGAYATVNANVGSLIDWVRSVATYGYYIL